MSGSSLQGQSYDCHYREVMWHILLGIHRVLLIEFISLHPPPPPPPHPNPPPPLSTSLYLCSLSFALALSFLLSFSLALALTRSLPLSLYNNNHQCGTPCIGMLKFRWRTSPHLIWVCCIVNCSDTKSVRKHHIYTESYKRYRCYVPFRVHCGNNVNMDRPKTQGTKRKTRVVCKLSNLNYSNQLSHG